MPPLVRSRFYSNIEENQKGFNKIIDEIVGPSNDYTEPIVLTRGQLVRLGCCLTNLTNSLLWREEERIHRVMGDI